MTRVRVCMFIAVMLIGKATRNPNCRRASAGWSSFSVLLWNFEFCLSAKHFVLATLPFQAVSRHNLNKKWFMNIIAARVCHLFCKYYFSSRYCCCCRVWFFCSHTCTCTLYMYTNFASRDRKRISMISLLWIFKKLLITQTKLMLLWTF